ncbi:probable phosphorylase b kinase regulatory subunit beta isoform X2 [Chrysoperla carnea]|uniref:probable phosphorylase b kinase regulatory subunit beta isoform X2 n=1 Tax=Chrysoperla carnea TaxID=189513 RepID=UPI001D07A47E|nr:probable phosphorylase b kinase regulatory subunit beta isoform X2 [Chrysoperla carnea]
MHTEMIMKQSSIDEVSLEQFLKINNYEDAVRQLDNFYGIVKRQLLRYQSPVNGLWPVLSTDTQVGSVRDSIYCAASVWGLYQAYRRIDDDRGKSYELGQSAVKCMRGILHCWARQAERVEAFKRNQNFTHALHVKFNLITGEPVLSDTEYHHLQIDVVSLYLLFLVQMITSGLQIIYTQDEVAFVQNLVYYVERAYRTPDYGMWERGSKYNDGIAEIHASSIGMAKSALEAINGCNLFGDSGAAWSVVYVDIDAHNRNRSIFETMLPRESSSKSVDASLLMTISFPAFATHEEHLYTETKTTIIRNLKREYGFIRFCRDGYKNVLEDENKRYYQEGEIKKYDNIECEWPLFYIAMIIDGVFKSCTEQVEEYKKLLKNVMRVDPNGDPFVPQYFYIPKDSVEADYTPEELQSIPRICPTYSENGGLFLWNQALFVIANLLTSGLLHINELDPIRRYLPSYNRPRRGGRYSAFQGTATDLVVQIVLIAESARLQAMMATYGIQTQTPHEVEPVQIWSSAQLVSAYECLGVSAKLGLRGRPARPIGSLGTSKVYRVCGMTVLCYPLIFEVSEFYLYRDMALLIDDIKTELQFVGRYWRLSGRPTVCLLIREEHMRDTQFKRMLDLLAMLKKGHCDGMKVRIGRLQNLISSSCIEHLDFMNSSDMPEETTFKQFRQLEHDYIGYQSLTDIPKSIAEPEDGTDWMQMLQDRPVSELQEAFRATESLLGQCIILGLILKSAGPQYKLPNSELTVSEILKNVYDKAGTKRHWVAVRHASSLLQHTVDSISPFITAVLVNGKQITVGVIGQKETTFDKPMTPDEIRTIMYSTIQPYDIIQAVLQQEVVLYCGRLIATNPELFRGILKIRVGWVVEAMRRCLLIRGHSPQRPVEARSPYEVRQLVNRVLNADGWIVGSLTCLQRRQLEGCLCRVPAHFYKRVYDVLARTPLGIQLCGNHLPQQPTLSNMTRSEITFALLVEQLLNRIDKPEYRQIVVELLCIIATILERNPELTFNTSLDLDALVKDAAELLVQYSDNKDDALNKLMGTPRSSSTGYLARAVVNNVLQGCHLQQQDISDEVEVCEVS